MSITLEDLEFEEIELQDCKLATVKSWKMTTVKSCEFEVAAAQPNEVTRAFNSDDLDIISLGGHSDLDINDVEVNDEENAQQTVSTMNSVIKTTVSEKRQATVEEKPAKQTKWGTLRRIGEALGIVKLVSNKTAGSAVKGCDVDGDELSFDGHLFEYSPHPAVVPRVEIPRLRLKPTLRERVTTVFRRLLVCAFNKRRYQYRQS